MVPGYDHFDLKFWPIAAGIVEFALSLPPLQHAYGISYKRRNANSLDFSATPKMRHGLKCLLSD
jgi:hypothetical protein